MSIRSQVVNLLKSILVISGMVTIAIKRQPLRLRILMYHGICSQGLTPEMFEWQLKYIKRHFDTYWMSEVPGLISEGPRGDKPAIVLTFDDGLKNNHQFAAPMLKKYNIKATFFLVSGLLGGNQMLWNHDLCCRLYLMPEKEMEKLTGLRDLHSADKWLILRKFVNTYKSRDNQARLDFINKVKNVTGNLEFSSEMKENYEIMSVNDVKLLPGIIEIGGHTVTHPMLDQVTNDEALQEITQCKKDLENITGKSVLSFCYPNGNYSDEAMDCVAGHFDCAVSVHEGFAECGANLFELKRIPTGRNKLDFVFRMLSPTS